MCQSSVNPGSSAASFLLILVLGPGCGRSTQLAVAVGDAVDVRAACAGMGKTQLLQLICFCGALCRTPVYMSPELINSRNGAKGYDGKQVCWPAQCAPVCQPMPCNVDERHHCLRICTARTCIVPCVVELPSPCGRVRSFRAAMSCARFSCTSW